MKKHLWICIILVFFIVFFAFALPAAANQKGFSGGDGNAENPYQVATAEDLDNMRHYPDAYFRQTADIDLGMAPWSEGDGW